MKIKFELKKIKDIKAEALASVLFEDSIESKLEWLNTLFKNNFEVIINSNDFKGKLSTTLLKYLNGDNKTSRILLTGLGKSKEISLENLRKAYASSAKYFNSLGLKVVGFELPDLTAIKGITNYSIQDIVQAICEGVLLTQYKFKKYTSNNELTLFEEVIFFTDSPKHAREINDSLRTTKIITDAVFIARDLGNEPSNFLTPAKFAEQVKKISSKSNFSASIFDEKKIKQLNMGGISGVSQGSSNPPRFLILQYFGSSKSEKPVVLIGKGVTFDSGGISLKTASGMETMKMDMCGAAAVVGAFDAISKLKYKINLIGLIPVVENMPSGTALKPGDVISTYAGTTIEVINTDAEGRLILADALDYAANYKPKAAIDVATLTGGVVVTFGHLCSAVMGTNSDLINQMIKAGKKTYERVWELPLFDEYNKLMKSEIADIKNSSASREASTILGGIFLKKFVSDKYPWMHIDIAGTAIAKEPGDYTQINSTGVGVRLLTEFIKHFNLTS